jgi:predicted nucleic acid-binding protein
MGRVELRAEYEEMLSGGNTLRMTAVTRGVLTRASEVRAKTGLMLADAIHVASAEACSCQAIVTNDLRLRNQRELPVITLPELVA